jgi:hypothetical protein
LAEWEQFGKRRNKEEERKKRQNERKDLTLTGLLMVKELAPFEALDATRIAVAIIVILISGFWRFGRLR